MTKQNDNNDKPSKKNGGKYKHDQLFKQLMANKEVATEFLEEYLPPKLKERVDLSTLKLEKETHIDEVLRNRANDVIYSLKSTNGGEDIFSYVIIEQQSRSDASIGTRLHRYTSLLLERHVKDNKKLPMVCRIVVYNGKKNLQRSLKLLGLFC